MLDFQGVSTYKSDNADRRQSAANTPAPSGTGKDRPSPGGGISFGQPLRDSSTFQFQTARTAMPLTEQASRQPVYAPPPENTAPAAGKTPLHLLPALLERVIAQIGSFFLGRRRDTPTGQEQDNRRLNDFFTLDFLGESKVEPVQQSMMGDGSN